MIVLLDLWPSGHARGLGYTYTSRWGSGCTGSATLVRSSLLRHLHAFVPAPPGRQRPSFLTLCPLMYFFRVYCRLAAVGSETTMRCMVAVLYVCTSQMTCEWC